MLRVALLAVLVPTVAFAANVPVDAPYGDDDSCRHIAEGASESLLITPIQLSKAEVFCSFIKPTPVKKIGKSWVAYCDTEGGLANITFTLAKQKDGTIVYSDDQGDAPVTLHRCP